MGNREKKIRAFIAVRVGDAVEASLNAFVASIRAERDGVAWVRPTNLHLTLKFLGPAVEVARIDPLVELLRLVAARIQPFEIRAVGVGAFPNVARPNVIWAGLESEPLVELATKLDEAAGECGFQRERRPYSPHLTIGRVRDSRASRRLREPLEAEREHEFGASRVESMALYCSQLSPGGSIYTALATFPLAADS